MSPEHSTQDLAATLGLLATTLPHVEVIIVRRMPPGVPWRVHGHRVYLAGCLTLDQAGTALADATTALRAALQPRPVLTSIDGGLTDSDDPISASGPR